MRSRETVPNRFRYEMVFPTSMICSFVAIMQIPGWAPDPVKGILGLVVIVSSVLVANWMHVSLYDMCAARSRLSDTPNPPRP